MAKRAAEFKIQRKSEKLKQKDTVRKIRENRGSASPEPSSSSTTDWQSQIYCLPDNILSCDPNASGQTNENRPGYCFLHLPQSSAPDSFVPVVLLVSLLKTKVAKVA